MRQAGYLQVIGAVAFGLFLLVACDGGAPTYTGLLSSVGNVQQEQPDSTAWPDSSLTRLDTLFLRPPPQSNQVEVKLKRLLAVEAGQSRSWRYLRYRDGEPAGEAKLVLANPDVEGDIFDPLGTMTDSLLWGSAEASYGVRFGASGLGIDSSGSTTTADTLPIHWSTAFYPRPFDRDTLYGFIERTIRADSLLAERGELVIVQPDSLPAQLSFMELPSYSVRRERWSVDSLGARRDTVEREYFRVDIGMIKRVLELRDEGTLTRRDSTILHRIDFSWPFPLPEDPSPPEGDIAEWYPFDSTVVTVYRRELYETGELTSTSWYADRQVAVRSENGSVVWEIDRWEGLAGPDAALEGEPQRQLGESWYCGPMARAFRSYTERILPGFRHYPWIVSGQRQVTGSASTETILVASTDSSLSLPFAGQRSTLVARVTETQLSMGPGEEWVYLRGLGVVRHTIPSDPSGRREVIDYAGQRAWDGGR